MFITLLFVALSTMTEEPPVFLNLDFETVDPRGVPVGWFVEGSPATVSTVEGLDGGRALLIEHGSEEPVVVYTPLPLEDEEVSLKMTAEIRGDAPVAAVVLAGKPLLSPPVVPDLADWQRLEFEVMVPRADSPRLSGFMVMGKGSIRIDRVRLWIGDEPIRDAAEPVVGSENDVAMVTRGAIALPAKNSEMEALFRDSRIIGLGENSHGAAALFSLKQQIVSHLLEKHAFEVFALEMPVLLGRRVDAYIQGNTDNRDVVLEALTYPAWQTREMMAVLDALRAHNETASSPVLFRGFDVQMPQLTLSHLAKRNPSLPLDDLEALMTAGDVVSALKELERLMAGIEQEETREDLRLVKWGLTMDRPDLGGRSRAVLMAEQIKRLAASHDKIILWADNMHISRGPGAMGSFLAKRFGEDYRAIGLTFNQGRYSAYGPDNPYPVHEGYPGTHEFLFGQTGLDTFLLDLNTLSSRAATRMRLGFRSIGSRPQVITQFLPMRLEDHFDIIGFTRETKATRYLIEHSF